MKLRNIIIGCAALTVVACGGDKAEQAPAPKPAEPVAESTPAPTALPRTPSADGARVFFITPANGDTVSNPVRIEFGVEGMNIVAAGVNEPLSGHHHLLIDTDLPDVGMPIPADEHHIHFGDGSTSTEITLPPGEHNLQLLLADHLHIPHEPPLVSQSISITVE